MIDNKTQFNDFFNNDELYDIRILMIYQKKLLNIQRGQIEKKNFQKR